MSSTTNTVPIRLRSLPDDDVNALRLFGFVQPTMPKRRCPHRIDYKQLTVSLVVKGLTMPSGLCSSEHTHVCAKTQLE